MFITVHFNCQFSFLGSQISCFWFTRWAIFASFSQEYKGLYFSSQFIFLSNHVFPRPIYTLCLGYFSASICWSSYLQNRGELPISPIPQSFNSMSRDLHLIGLILKQSVGLWVSVVRLIKVVKSQSLVIAEIQNVWWPSFWFLHSYLLFTIHFNINYSQSNLKYIQYHMHFTFYLKKNMVCILHGKFPRLITSLELSSLCSKFKKIITGDQLNHCVLICFNVFQLIFDSYLYCFCILSFVTSI